MPVWSFTVALAEEDFARFFEYLNAQLEPHRLGHGLIDRRSTPTFCFQLGEAAGVILQRLFPAGEGTFPTAGGNVPVTVRQTHPPAPGQIVRDRPIPAADPGVGQPIASAPPPGASAIYEILDFRCNMLPPGYKVLRKTTRGAIVAPKGTPKNARRNFPRAYSSDSD